MAKNGDNQQAGHNKRLSMFPLSLEQALRGLMQTPPPNEGKRDEGEQQDQRGDNGGGGTGENPESQG